MARYRKPRKQIDLSKLKQDSQEYWEEVLKREGLSMSRGKYPMRLTYAWNYHDSDKRNENTNTPEAAVPQPLSARPIEDENNTGPESKQTATDYGVNEDGYSEDSKP